MKTKIFPLICFLLFSTVCKSALASSYDAYPQREILRPLVLPRGYLEFATSFSWNKTSRAFDGDGDLEGIGADITEWIWDARIAVGLFEGLELQVGVPYIFKEFDVEGNPAVEGFGDMDAALLIHLYYQTAQRPTSVALGVRGIFPTGETEIGDEFELYLKPPARGTYAVGVFMWVREAYKPWLGALYTFEWDFYFKGRQKFEGVTVDTDYGDIMRVSVEPIIQISDYLALWLSNIYTAEYKSEFEHDGVVVAEYKNSMLYQFKPALQIQLGKHFDLYLGSEWRYMGRYTLGGYPIWGKLEVRF